MSERWVLNASPLIVLARVGQEHLFHTLADKVVVPRAVAVEIEAGSADDPARQVIAGEHFAVVEAVPVSEVLAWDLGAGETAVLSYALRESGWTVIPVSELSALARVERPDLARPPLYLHKWWARRFGSVFRSIILATFLSPEENAWDYHYRHTDFGGKIILDPFMGGGTTVDTSRVLSN